MTNEERVEIEEIVRDALSPIRINLAMIRQHLDRFSEQLSRLP